MGFVLWLIIGGVCVVLSFASALSVGYVMPLDS
jgi:hypothetical protein